MRIGAHRARSWFTQSRYRARRRGKASRLKEGEESGPKASKEVTISLCQMQRAARERDVDHALQSIIYGRARYFDRSVPAPGTSCWVDCSDRSKPDRLASREPSNVTARGLFDPFKGKLAGPALPPEIPSERHRKQDSILVGPALPGDARPSAQGDPAGIEATGLENLQRGFDFYSWRTFIALNSPADGTPIDSEQRRRTCRRYGRI